MTVPVGETGRWVDTGLWRRLGVIHFHLVAPRRWSTLDPARLSPEQVRAERGTLCSGGVAATPHEVAYWLNRTRESLIAEHKPALPLLQASGLATAEDQLAMRQAEFHLAQLGRDVRATLELGDGVTLHWSAYAVTRRDCTAGH